MSILEVHMLMKEKDETSTFIIYFINRKSNSLLPPSFLYYKSQIPNKQTLPFSLEPSLETYTFSPIYIQKLAHFMDYNYHIHSRIAPWEPISLPSSLINTTCFPYKSLIISIIYYYLSIFLVK